MRAIKILRMKIIASLFNIGGRERNPASESSRANLPGFGIGGTPPQEFDDFTDENGFTKIFSSPNEYLFHCGLDTYKKHEYKEFYVFKKLEYNIVNGIDFILVKDDPSINKLIETNKLRKSAQPRMQKVRKAKKIIAHNPYMPEEEEEEFSPYEDEELDIMPEIQS